MERITEFIGRCVSCGKEHFSGNVELEKLWMYHKKIGIFCKDHPELVHKYDRYVKEDAENFRSKS